MSAASVVVALSSYLVGLVTALIYLCTLKKREVCFAKNDNFKDVRLRLNAYALMKQPCAVEYHPPVSNLGFVPSGMMISHDQHDILLGALKKIEAKSAVLVAIVIFTFPVLIGQTNFLRELSSGVELPLYSAAGILTAMLLSGADGAAHLGQPHFREKIATMPSTSIWGRELQKILIEDMLRKEASFRASLKLAVLVLALFLIAYLLFFWVCRNEIITGFGSEIRNLSDMVLR